MSQLSELFSKIDQIFGDTDDTLVDALSQEIINDDRVTEIIADTNAVGWGLYQIDVSEIKTSYDKEKNEVVYTASFWFGVEGEQDGEDRMDLGTDFDGTAQIELRKNSFDLRIISIRSPLEKMEDEANEAASEDEPEFDPELHMDEF